MKDLSKKIRSGGVEKFDLKRLGGNTQGKGDFDYEILKLCKTKGELGYTETMYQFKEDVLEAKFPDGTRKYYNSNIMNRWFAKE